VFKGRDRERKREIQRGKRKLSCLKNDPSTRDVVPDYFIFALHLSLFAPVGLVSVD